MTVQKAAVIEYDGESFPFVADPNTFTLDELEVIEQHYGDDFDAIMKGSKLRATRALVWVSISRGRPGFTLDDAGAVPMGAVAVAATALRAKAPQDHQAKAGEVLSPTSAGPVRTAKRAARKSPGVAAGTRRSSRTSSGSARGSSDS